MGALINRHHWLDLHELRELSKVRSSETGDGVPARRAREASLAAAVLVVALGDVIECGGVGGGDLIEPGVEEAERGLALRPANLVEERNDGREGGGRGRGATDDLDLAALL